ncbi:MAG: hypothetical protein JWN96_1731 [Mycobacterium sp.]|nr:hypothetical protein [Mycobacterium sp.]
MPAVRRCDHPSAGGGRGLYGPNRSRVPLLSRSDHAQRRDVWAARKAVRLLHVRDALVHERRVWSGRSAFRGVATRGRNRCRTTGGRDPSPSGTAGRSCSWPRPARPLAGGDGRVHRRRPHRAWLAADVAGGGAGSGRRRDDRAAGGLESQARWRGMVALEMVGSEFPGRFDLSSGGLARA